MDVRGGTLDQQALLKNSYGYPRHRLLVTHPSEGILTASPAIEITRFCLDHSGSNYLLEAVAFILAAGSIYSLTNSNASLFPQSK
jgi:hypothetical protein